MVSIWTVLADAINPILALLAITVAIISLRAGGSRSYWLLSLASVAIAVGIAEFGKWLPVWPGHPEFPSGHETLGVAISTCLVLRKPNWLWITAPLCALLGVSLVGAHFHHPIEVLGGVIVGIIPPILLLRRRAVIVDQIS